MPSGSMHRMHLQEVLAQTEHDLSAAQILVRDLSYRRLQLREDLNSTALISLLPWDLKHNIFLTVNDDDGGYRMPLLSLAAVCVEWRQIILDIPRLWGKIYLAFHKKIASGDILFDDAKLSLVKDWLERGKQVPLYITVLLQDKEDGDDLAPEELSQDLFLELLNRHSKRWRHITLGNVSPEHFELEMFCRPGYLPLLYSLDILTSDGFDPHGDGPLFKNSYFLHAPSLREADIGAFSLEEIILPWHQLEKLQGEGQPISVYHTLSSSHNLLKCKLLIGSGDNEVIPHDISLPKLQTLALTVDDCDLVEILHVPALKDYRHTLYGGNACYDFDALSGLIKRSSCHLNVLHVDADMMDDGFLRCIQLLSSLVELKLYLSSCDEFNDDAFDALWLPDSFINSLNPDTDENTLLPRLEIFTYDGSTDFQFKTLLAMLCRRGRRGSSAVSQITRLSIRSRNAIPGFNDAVMKELGLLREEGIEIEIRASMVKERDITWQTNFLSTNGL